MSTKCVHVCMYVCVHVCVLMHSQTYLHGTAKIASNLKGPFQYCYGVVITFGNSNAVPEITAVADFNVFSLFTEGKSNEFSSLEHCLRNVSNAQFGSYSRFTWYIGPFSYVAAVHSQRLFHTPKQIYSLPTH